MKIVIPQTVAQVKRLTLDKLKTEYNELAEEYNRIIGRKIIYCGMCGDYLPEEEFMPSAEFKSGIFPICRKCLLDMATDYDRKNARRLDNRSKTLRVFHMLNLPFIEEKYNYYLEKGDPTAAQQLLAYVRSAPTMKDKAWSDVIIERPASTASMGESGPARAEIKKLFGSGFSEEDYIFLQDQYDDWRARTQVDSKSQETYVQQICLSLLEIDKDRKMGKDVTNKLRALDILMNSANLQPKQNVSNAAANTLTFGQLIEKWENERPISEPSEEFKDVDGIEKYIRVWFTGWLSKALGLKANVFTTEFDKEISQYEVKRPDYDEDDETNNIYNEIFGDENGG